MSTIFSICRMLISLVHFLDEAATRRMASCLGSRLDASHAFFRQRASGTQSLAGRHVKRVEDDALLSPVGITGLQITERQGIVEMIARGAAGAGETGGNVRSSSRVSSPCPPPLPWADSGTLRNGRSAVQSSGGRTTNVHSPIGARPS
jgi:hypothetical protein